MLFLAVDDERLQLNKLVDCLKEVAPKDNVIFFDNPLTAYETAKRSRIDAAFLDIEMAGMNGVELAKKLKAINPNINIVFVTGYAEYALDAYSLHASGYLTKPVTVEKLKAELLNLRYPMPGGDSADKLRAQCFGRFEVFYNGIPLKFARSKTKEMLAYLIDRNGAMVSVSELSQVLFGEEKNSYVRNLVADLNKTLREYKIQSAFIRRFNSYGISRNDISCDYYDYVRGEPYAVKAYRGEYMNQYSWDKLAKFD